MQNPIWYWIGRLTLERLKERLDLARQPTEQDSLPLLYGVQPVVDVENPLALPRSGQRTKITCTGASAQALPIRPSRKQATFVNLSDANIGLALGGLDSGISTAVVNEGIVLFPRGGSYEINSTNMWTGPIYAISTAGGKELALMDVF